MANGCRHIVGWAASPLGRNPSFAWFWPHPPLHRPCTPIDTCGPFLDPMVSLYKIFEGSTDSTQYAMFALCPVAHQSRVGGQIHQSEVANRTQCSQQQRMALVGNAAVVAQKSWTLPCQDGVNIRLEILIFRGELQTLNGEEASRANCVLHRAS